MAIGKKAKAKKKVLRVKPVTRAPVPKKTPWTLGQGLGEAFTAEVKEAWVAAYGVLAKTMKDAAATAESLGCFYWGYLPRTR